MLVTTTKAKLWRSNAFRSNLLHGILRHETFAVKNMDNLLKLKLDMVYRDLDMETAQKRFSEATVAPPAPAAAPEPVAPTAPTKVRRKVVKVLVPKSK